MVLTVFCFCTPTPVHAGGKVAAWGDNSYGQCLLPNGLNNVKAIAAGAVHNLALEANGTVIGWGYNVSGRASPPPGLSDVVAIAAGGSHSMALRANGQVVAWGNNVYGQTNVPAGLSDVIAIAAGGQHSLALKADGTVIAWGWGYYGQTNVPVGLSHVVAIAGGPYHSLALRMNGTVAAWGMNYYGQTNVPSDLANVVAIAAGYYQSLALKADGTVVAWGSGYDGQTNAPLGLSNVVAIAAGYYQSLALKADRTVVAWGFDYYGVTNVPSGMANVTAIAAGAEHALAIVPDGPPEIVSQPGNAAMPYQSNLVLTVVANGLEPLGYRWFFNDHPLTNTTRILGADTTSLTISHVQFADAGTYRVVVSNAFGSVQSSGAVLTVISPPIITQQPVGQTNIAGTNLSLSMSAMGTPPLSYQWLLNGVQISRANSNLLSLMNVQSSQSGDYVAVVSNAYGVVTSDIAAVTVLESPPYILTQPVGQSAIFGGVASFSVSARGSTPLSYQWRFNGVNIPGATNTTLALTSLRYDQAGYYNVAISNVVGEIVSVKAFLSVNQVAVWRRNFPNSLPTNMPPDFTNLVAISACSHLLALKADGTVVAWEAARSPRPYFAISSEITNVPPGLTNVSAISAGSSYSLALKSDGTVVAWGRRHDVQTNVPAGLSNVVGVAAGLAHSLALKTDGTIAAWGEFLLPLFGWRPPPSQPATNIPPGLSNVTAIAAGSDHSLALKNDGTVVAWGFPYATNVPENLSNVIAIACGDGFDLALQDNGNVVAWSTTLGRSPDPWPPWPTIPTTPGPSSVVSNTPPGLSNVVAIAAGSDGMALKSDGSVTVWDSSTNPLPAGPAGMSNVFAISAGSYFLAALIGSGSPHFTIQPASQTVTRGATVQFHARAAGVQPLNYQWERDGENLSGATNTDLTITNVQGKDTGGYRVVVANALGTATSAVAQLLIPFNTNLAVALNATNLVWTTSPTNAPWFAQNQETHDGDAAAQSGDIDDGQQSVLETTVIGPGALTFWWKVSSEEGYDFLSFFLDDSVSPLAGISGATDWQQPSFVVPAGSHVLRWTYSKDGSVSAGQDAGWVDEVVFTPAPPVITTQPASQTQAMGANVIFTVAATGTPPLNYQWLKAGTNLMGATNSTLLLAGVGRCDAGVHAMRVANPGGSVESSNAILTVQVPQQLCAPTILSDGSFTFTSGDADGGMLLPENVAGFEVEASTNLVNWVGLPGVLTLTNGSLLLQDSGCSNYPVRFYRITEH